MTPVLTRENARKHFRPIIIKKLYQISQHFHLHRHVLTFRFPSSVHATSLRRIIDTSDEVNQNSVDKSTCGLIRTSAIPVYIRCQLVPRLTYWKSMPRTFDKALPPSLSLCRSLALPFPIVTRMIALHSRVNIPLEDTRTGKSCIDLHVLRTFDTNKKSDCQSLRYDWFKIFCENFSRRPDICRFYSSSEECILMLFILIFI